MDCLLLHLALLPARLSNRGQQRLVMQVGMSGGDLNWVQNSTRNREVATLKRHRQGHKDCKRGQN
jgi:hypothetical protein